MDTGLIYKSGVIAFNGGQDINACPFSGVNVDTPEYNAWCDGWNDAKMDSEDREYGA